MSRWNHMDYSEVATEGAVKDATVRSDDDVRTLKARVAQLESSLEESNHEVDILLKQLAEVEQELIKKPLEPHEIHRDKELPKPIQLHKPKYAILTAYEGDKYKVMARLSSQTKAKYAARQDYAFFIGNDLLRPGMSFSQKSAVRIELFRRHWDEFDWLMWTDADVLFTNPDISLYQVISKAIPPELVNDKHVIMSKDWGGRQVNPGVSLIRTTPQGKEFLDRWEAEIREANSHDDLLAIRDGMEKKKAPELKYVVFVEQHVLNSYPHLTLKHEPYNESTAEHHKSHQLWQPGHLMVHVVNCLRQWHKIDEHACNGVAAYYWTEFMTRLENAQQTMAVRQDMDFDMEREVLKDWTLRFRADLCLDGFGE
eukprot:Plantae.Rhodophyta-Rhodochaete_pulchella.ctg39631.p2 GENE.Plantae.Rhodophyta-Rhodochaete_pulchella.ctg39631~~Plantae.Rhodophyta-Rhodochaete_pulchella.ctg39631.p2  ORF type:complete len:377 (+),score=97.02 Plantae.Rhodophyta-Rhodochaete_pulchella.ctg39631:25-1131(+)